MKTCSEMKTGGEILILLRLLIIIVVRLIVTEMMSPRRATLKVAEEEDVSFSALWAMLPDTYK